MQLAFPMVVLLLTIEMYYILSMALTMPPSAQGIQNCKLVVLSVNLCYTIVWEIFDVEIFSHKQ